MQSRSTQGATTQDAADPLARIEARLARIEAMLARYDALAQEVPAIAAVATDAFDEWAARDGRADERLKALVALAERLSRPQVLRSLEALVHHAEALPGVLGTLMDTLDDLSRQAEASGVDVETLVSRLIEGAHALARLGGSPEARELMESGLLTPETLATLTRASRSLAETQRSAPSPIGVWGALRAMGDPDVQRALGFAVHAAKGFGHALEDSAPTPDPERRSQTGGEIR